jgi:hypothetical protein
MEIEKITIRITVSEVDAAANYLKTIQGSTADTWDELPEGAKQRYRNQVMKVLYWCGFNLPEG